ncbi:hypothetical protein EZ428_20205 [Pedobacter frigiditerrae]|uniref:Uncharacterized protein n=1 Tax=Pedobacter frigiditerrae TaxID=2530452 RepID=A0A4R0MMT1_9SPHI|nr:hypothetical protein [Pedobacter frigiditerrae]TCC88048.1 hypothetical protein EZ428_20205 [Pedobacter frigiditerrae]
MQSFEITHWGKQILVIPLGKMEFKLYYNDELIASITNQLNAGRSYWSSPNLDASEANLLGSIITSKLY